MRPAVVRVKRRRNMSQSPGSEARNGVAAASEHGRSDMTPAAIATRRSRRLSSWSARAITTYPVRVSTSNCESLNHVVLAKRVAAALRGLNAWLSDGNVPNAVRGDARGGDAAHRGD
jgi:hypothetical protein